MGALRLSVACTGYPVDAVTLTARIITDPADVGQTAFDTPDNVTLYKITSHVPYEWQTDGELENWAVTQHLIFYSANYHGWC